MLTGNFIATMVMASGSPRTKEVKIPRNGASVENSSPSGVNSPPFVVDSRLPDRLRALLPVRIAHPLWWMAGRVCL